MQQKNMRRVSLSGKTRLTYRQAVALLHAANHGLVSLEAEAFEGNARANAEIRPLELAIAKLKNALDASGGYDSEGNLYNPFERCSKWERTHNS